MTSSQVYRGKRTPPTNPHPVPSPLHLAHHLDMAEFRVFSVYILIISACGDGDYSLCDISIPTGYTASVLAVFS